MASLEYSVGGIDINNSCIVHKFVVEEKSAENKHMVEIYVGDGGGHLIVIDHYNLEEGKIIAGGDVVIDGNGDVVIEKSSGNYGAMPKKAAEEFGMLLARALGCRGYIANPDEGFINRRWYKLGFNGRPRVRH